MKNLIAHLSRAILGVVVGFVNLQSQPRAEWFHSYQHYDASCIRDVYLKADGGLAMCGYTEWPKKMWFLNANQDGAIIVEDIYDAPGRLNSGMSFAHSLIETDNGDFILGGWSNARDGGGSGDIAVIKIDEQGEMVWFNQYGPDNARSDCNAVIELKSGNFAIAGYVFADDEYTAYLAVVNGEGGLVWENLYGEEATRESFVALREVEDEGMVVLGRKAPVGQRTCKFWLIKVDFEGEILWEQRYEDGEEDYENPVGMTSCRGGFALAGNARPEGENHPFILRRVDGEGEHLFRRTYTIWDERPYAECRGICRMPDDGFLLIGGAYTGGGEHFPAAMVRTSAGGNELWRLAQLFGGGQNAARFDGAIAMNDGSVVVVGDFSNEDIDVSILAFAEKFFPDNTAPRIVRWNPHYDDVAILPQNPLTFSIFAEDEEDSIIYFWRLDDDTVSNDTLWEFTAEGSAEFTLLAIASDGLLEDRRVWQVSVSDLFIYSYSPDTLALALRRSASVDFSLDSVAAVFPQDEIQYQWTLTDLDNFDSWESGAEAGATIEFLRSGNFRLEGLAFAGEGDNLAQDNVIWTIQVRSAILDFLPHSLNLSIPRGAVIAFELIPFNPESDSLRHQWLLDGEPWDVDSLAVVIPFP